jgi:DNA polymerase-1
MVYRSPTVGGRSFRNRASAAACCGAAAAGGGGRRRLHEVNGDNRVLRANGERVAIDTPRWGSAADIIKVAMVRIDDALGRERLASRLVLQVHDELVPEVPEAEVDLVREMVVREMAAAADLKVPLVLDTGMGANWDEAH